MKGLLLTINLYTVAGSIWVRLLLVGDGAIGEAASENPNFTHLPFLEPLYRQIHFTG